LDQNRSNRKKMKIITKINSFHQSQKNRFLMVRLGLSD
jgi:hypothetical protein